MKAQIDDNLTWIRAAGENKMVVGSQARILYADSEGRSAIAVAMNTAVKTGRLSAPVVISRDHHDVSGTDSPFRETSNIMDGSSFCADMAVQVREKGHEKEERFIPRSTAVLCVWRTSPFLLTVDTDPCAKRSFHSFFSSSSFLCLLPSSFFFLPFF